MSIDEMRGYVVYGLDEKLGCNCSYKFNILKSYGSQTIMYEWGRCIRYEKGCLEVILIKKTTRDSFEVEAKDLIFRAGVV